MRKRIMPSYRRVAAFILALGGLIAEVRAIHRIFHLFGADIEAALSRTIGFFGRADANGIQIKVLQIDALLDAKA